MESVKVDINCTKNYCGACLHAYRPVPFKEDYWCILFGAQLWTEHKKDAGIRIHRARMCKEATI